MQISVIIPMYNESKIIADTARTLSDYMQKHFDSYEILFSDDGSVDGCGDIVRALSLPDVRVTGYTQNHGKGHAVRYAVLEAKGDLVLFTDADLAYGVEVIRRAYDFYLENAQSQSLHMVIGSRNLAKDGYENYSVLRKIMSKVYIRLLCIVGRFQLSDSQCGFKAFEREAAHDIFSRCKVDGFAFDFEAILWAEQLGYRIAEFPVKVVNHRESKVRIIRDTVKMLKDIRTIRKSIKKDSKKK